MRPSALASDDRQAMEDVPVHYRRWKLADYPARMVALVEPFFIDESRSILLSGGVGTRKTSFAAAILRRWRALGLPSGVASTGVREFIEAPTFAAVCRNMEHGQHTLGEWRRAPILVLDDLGSARSTPHLVECLLLLLSARYNRDLPTIATTNLSLPELAEVIDARLASRLQDGLVLDMGTTDTRAGPPADRPAVSVSSSAHPWNPC